MPYLVYLLSVLIVLNLCTIFFFYCVLVYLFTFYCHAMFASFFIVYSCTILTRIQCMCDCVSMYGVCTIHCVSKNM